MVNKKPQKALKTKEKTEFQTLCTKANAGIVLQWINVFCEKYPQNADEEVASYIIKKHDRFLRLKNRGCRPTDEELTILISLIK